MSTAASSPATITRVLPEDMACTVFSSPREVEYLGPSVRPGVPGLFGQRPRKPAPHRGYPGYSRVRDVATGEELDVRNTLLIVGPVDALADVTPPLSLVDPRPHACGVERCPLAPLPGRAFCHEHDGLSSVDGSRQHAIATRPTRGAR